MENKKINILGTEYTIRFLNDKEYPKLELSDANGLSELYSKELIINSGIDHGKGTEYESLDKYVLKVVRHEIVHAFFHESGLHDNYCQDELLVDWIALQLPKIYKACVDAECEDL